MDFIEFRWLGLSSSVLLISCFFSLLRTGEEDAAAGAREPLGLRGLADPVDVAQREVQDRDLDEARERRRDHLAHEHRARRDLHVVAELEVPDEAQGLRPALTS